MKNQSGTIKTNLELDRVVMEGSGGYRRLPGGSDHFSLQTHRQTLIIIYISSLHSPTSPSPPSSPSSPTLPPPDCSTIIVLGSTELEGVGCVPSALTRARVRGFRVFCKKNMHYAHFDENVKLLYSVRLYFATSQNLICFTFEKRLVHIFSCKRTMEKIQKFE